MKAVSQCSGATGESEILWPQSQHQLCLHLHSRARTAVRQRQTQPERQGLASGVSAAHTPRADHVVAAGVLVGRRLASRARPRGGVDQLPRLPVA